MEELSRLFEGWERLGGHYPEVPDGPSIQMRYGEKTVGSGGMGPKQVGDVRTAIGKLVAKMPVMEPSSGE
jgi:hypothetical protein